MGHEGQLEGLTPTNKQNVESCIFRLKHLGVQQALLKRVSYVRIVSGAPVNTQARGYVPSGLFLVLGDGILLSRSVKYCSTRKDIIDDEAALYERPKSWKAAPVIDALFLKRFTRNGF